MPISFTSEQILALAPDAASAKSSKSLAGPRAWESLGQSGEAVWGECKGSAKEPYRTQIDLRGPAFRCSCPSRKFPCKHGLGLLLLLADQPAAVPTAAPPTWVDEWLATRAKSAERRQERQQDAAAPDAAAQQRRATTQAKSAAAREAKVAAGMAELGRWLRDQLREGLAGAPQRAPAAFDRMAARMVDAQAPGAARLLREMAGTPASGDGWQGRLLEQLAHLYLLVEAHSRLDRLAPPRQADVRAALGFTTGQDELLQGAGLRDAWLVLGQRVVEEEQLRVQRTWLWGVDSGAPALILDFAAGRQSFDRSMLPGSRLAAELVFFPSSAPLRALVKPPAAAPQALTALPQQEIAAASAAYAAALAANPWLERYPLCLGPVTLEPAGPRWLIRDPAERCLPLAPGFARAWELLARSGGRPITMVGEWDGTALAPLSAWIDGFVPL